MPSIVGPYVPPFDPRDRPPIWRVPLGSLERRAVALLVICNGCTRRRRWPSASWWRAYGAAREVQDLCIRWRCSRGGSADCLPWAIDDRDRVPARPLPTV
jgi:hypothetical protein